MLNIFLTFAYQDKNQELQKQSQKTHYYQAEIPGQLAAL